MSFYLSFSLLVFSLLHHCISLTHSSHFQAPKLSFPVLIQHILSIFQYTFFYSPERVSYLWILILLKLELTEKKIFWWKLLALFIMVFATHHAYTDDWISLKYKCSIDRKDILYNKIILIFRLSHLNYCSINSHKQTGSGLNGRQLQYVE